MTFDTLQYWRARADRLEAELAQARNDAAEAHDKALEKAALKVLRLDRYRISSPTNLSEQAAAHAKAIRAMKTQPAMDPDTARAWRESDGDHRGHVEDRG